MNKSDLYWMNYSINIADKTNSLNLRVGAVLTTSDNYFICSSFTEEDSNSSWDAVLLRNIKKHNITKKCKLYLTINTLSSDLEFDLNRVLKKVAIKEIYIGLPDPNLTFYSQKDPIITLNNIYRYPDNLQRKILIQNNRFYHNSEQNIKFNQYYSQKRISDLVIEKLKEHGLIISKNELNSNKSIEDLTKFIVKKFNIDSKKAKKLVNSTLSEAFDSKYSSYNYSNDIRSLNVDWKNNFTSVCKKLFLDPINDISILDVGVGSGNEAITLFAKCKNITFVDIAPNGLRKIKEQIPHSKIIVSRAENLSSISNDVYDLYISLRTFNSSFFNIQQAIAEASRVLKHDAIILISVANGFLYTTKKIIIPGLIIPRTDFVDIYRAFDLIKGLSVELSKNKFIDIKIFPTTGEIFLSAKLKKL